MNPKLYIIGYYGHYNTGDEQYKLTFKYLFPTYDLHFLDCDQLISYNISQPFVDSDIIILGGGDILNEYFLDNIHAVFSNKPNKIIALSVGLPYTNILINTPKLNIIDTLFVRTTQDLLLFKEYFHNQHVYYLPDTSMFIENAITQYDNISLSSRFKRKRHSISSSISSTLSTISRKILPKSKFNIFTTNETPVQLSHLHYILSQVHSKYSIIAITLSRHIYSNTYQQEYNDFIQSFSDVIQYLIQRGFFIVFLPFNNGGNSSENDILIHNDIYNHITHNTKIPNIHSSIFNIDFPLLPSQTFQLYQYFHYTIPMRYHACLFSIFARVPTFPIFTTRKIKNLLLDYNITHSFKLNTNPQGIPITFNSAQFVQRLTTFIQLKPIVAYEYISREDYLDTILHHFTSPKVPIHTLTLPIDNKINFILDKIQHYLSSKNIHIDFRLVTNSNIKETIVQIVSYYLTNKTIDSIYNYGLFEKMFKPNYDFHNEWKWIINDYLYTTPKSSATVSHVTHQSINGLFNMNYIDQFDYSNVHRSGWQYVYNGLYQYHSDNAPLRLDLYIDRTFHWHKDINKTLGIIPYTQPWIGFVHHTFDTTFSQYNNHNLLNNPDFLISLQSCKGLFVLSQYLQQQWISILTTLDIHVPIFTLIHPTEINVPRFSYSKFIQNPNKKIIHVGSWLRNIYSFYLLQLPKTITIKSKYCYKKNPKYCIQKVVLKGKCSNNYYPTHNFLTDLHSTLVYKPPTHYIPPTISQNTSQNISWNPPTQESIIQNNWYKHFFQHVESTIHSVDSIDNLNNQEYDILLTNNIIFIHLVDASAINTLLEAITRHTPIIINKHPAVVELLGNSYPLYFSNTYNTSLDYYSLNQEIIQLLNSPSNIMNAYIHLKKLDKTQLQLETFLFKFTQIIKTLI